MNTAMTTKADPWWLLLLEGIAAVIVGILILIAPGKTVVALVTVFGFYLIVRGILYIVSMFTDHAQWAAKLVAGILALICGIIVIQHPLWVSALVPTTTYLLIGAGLLCVGLIGIGQAWGGASLGYAILGFLAVLIGAAFILNPFRDSAVLATIIGIAAVVGGIAAVVMAFRSR